MDIILPIPQSIFTFNQQVSGEFKFRKFKKDLLGREYTTFESDWNKNIITNTGLDNLGTLSDFTNYCFIGSGNTPTAATDTQLVSLIASNDTLEEETYSNKTIAPFYTTRTKRYRFNPPGTSGRNINEVGVGRSNSGLNLYSRVLTVDVNGTPTTVTQQADEYLDVIYQNKFYMPVADYTTTVISNAITYTLTARPAYVNSNNYWTIRQGFFQTNYNNIYCTAYNGAISTDLTAGPTGTTAGHTSYSVAAYTNGNYHRACTYTFGLSAGNLANGISALLVSSGNTAFQVGVSPAIPKDSSSSLQFTIDLNWSRYP